MVTRTQIIKWGLPIALLSLPTFSIFWLDELGAMLLIVTAVAVGAVLRPKHLWIVWLGVIVVWWLAGGAYSLWGEPPGPGEVEETAASFMIETVPFTALLVLLPMFLGRFLGNQIFESNKPREA